MPRRPANLKQADVQRIIRACQRERVPFRVTLQPNGAAVFEPANVPHAEQNAHKDSEQRKAVGQMSRGRQTFKESEAARLVRAVMAAGLAVRAVEVDPKSGKITVRTGDAAIGVGRIISRILLRYSLTDMKEKLPSAGERRMSEGRGFLIAFHRAGHVASRAESAN